MIRHPNYSGLQRDQITRTYTPAYFVRDVEVVLGGARLFTVEGAISLSENPSFRFLLEARDGDSLSARVEDTDGLVFSESWRLDAAARSGS
jgi:sulfur-oxidizing protein SoxY